MKTFFKILLGLIVILVIVYFMGPKPDAPKLVTPVINLPASLPDLEKQVNTEELAVKGLKPNNQARIIWADSAKKVKTKVAMLYLHGFTGSPADSYTLTTAVAKHFGANLYLFRNAHHGVDLGDSTLINAKADDFADAAERALAITEKLGDEVVVMGTSLGGALATYLASRHPEIKAIILYSPGAAPYDKRAGLASGPWGFQLAKLLTGSAYQNPAGQTAEQQQYNMKHYSNNGMIAGLTFIKYVMTPGTFEKVKCPVFLCYWYKNEQVQDKAASVKAMLRMFDELGTPAKLKRKEAFPEAGDHAISSFLYSKDVPHIEKETERFLEEVVLR